MSRESGGVCGVSVANVVMNGTSRPQMEWRGVRRWRWMGMCGVSGAMELEKGGGHQDRLTDIEDDRS